METPSKTAAVSLYQYSDGNTYTDGLTLEQAQEFKRLQGGGTITKMAAPKLPKTKKQLFRFCAGWDLQPANAKAAILQKIFPGGKWVIITEYANTDWMKLPQQVRDSLTEAWN